MFEKHFKKLFKEQGETLAKAYKKYKRENKAEMSKEEADKQAEAFISQYNFDEMASETLVSSMSIYIEAGIQGNNLVNLQFFTQQTNEERVLFNVIREDYVEWVNTMGANQIKHVTDTTKEIVRKTVSKSLQEGLGVNKTSEAISSKVIEIGESRAKTIALTETHNSIMYTTELNLKANGFKKWKWVTSQDERVRSTHASVNGQIRTIGKRFSNGLLRPGDPSAPPAQTVNCRCIVIPVA